MRWLATLRRRFRITEHRGVNGRLFLRIPLWPRSHSRACLYLHVYRRAWSLDGFNPSIAWHTHPWPNWSLILWGRFLEENRPRMMYLDPGSISRRAGRFVYRDADTGHRMMLLSRFGLTLFWHGATCNSIAGES